MTEPADVRQTIEPYFVGLDRAELTKARKIEQATFDLLAALGEDLGRDGLKNTPQRVAVAWLQLTQGYAQDPATILARQFEGEDYDEMIVVKDVPFTSLCEHHLLGFSGKATVGYIPNDDRIVGLSKIARLIECFARRIQVQERMTTQIARAIEEHLKPKGVGVRIVAKHSCMSIRGACKEGETVTSCLLGVMRDAAETRGEFMALSANGKA